MKRVVIHRWVVLVLALLSCPAIASAQQRPTDDRSKYRDAGPPHSEARGADQDAHPYRRVAQRTDEGGAANAPARDDGRPANAKSANPGSAPPRPQPPAPPFVLNEKQQAELDRTLKAWEEKSSKVKTFHSKFQMRSYLGGGGYGPSTKDPFYGHLNRYGNGVIKYKAPDHGAYEETESFQYSPPADPNLRTENMKPAELAKLYKEITTTLDHWVCDGQAIYSFDKPQKQLKVIPLPPDMRGKEIVNGPLPFIFGAKAEQLKAHYWLRLATPPDAKGEIWLEARPRFQKEASEYSQIELVMSDPNFEPIGMRMTLPGGTDQKVYIFKSPSFDDPLWRIFQDFSEPKPPSGWTRVVEEMPGAAPPADSKQVNRSAPDRSQGALPAAGRRPMMDADLKR